MDQSPPNSFLNKNYNMSMWVNETWETHDDVDKDIALLGEYRAPSVRDLDPNLNPMPDTIKEYKKRMEANKQRPLNSDLEESYHMSYVVSGRGRGISDRVIRPGGSVESHPTDDEELKRQIRQVSGMGHSNEFVERSVRANTLLNQKIEADAQFQWYSCKRKK